MYLYLLDDVRNYLQHAVSTTLGKLALGLCLLFSGVAGFALISYFIIPVHGIPVFVHIHTVESVYWLLVFAVIELMVAVFHGMNVETYSNPYLEYA